MLLYLGVSTHLSLGTYTYLAVYIGRHISVTTGGYLICRTEFLLLRVLFEFVGMSGYTRVNKGLHPLFLDPDAVRLYVEGCVWNQMLCVCTCVRVCVCVCVCIKPNRFEKKKKSNE